MRDLTSDERAAVNALRRIGKRWPKTIKLFSWSGSLVIFDTDDDLADPIHSVLATVPGIINDGGDP